MKNNAENVSLNLLLLEDNALDRKEKVQWKEIFNCYTVLLFYISNRKIKQWDIKQFWKLMSVSYH